MKPFPLKTSAILVVALCLTATEAEACGEVMLRTLDTMRFHAFVTHHPASVLIYSGNAGNHPAGQAGKLHDGLEKAGHKVSMVRGPEQLAKALAAQKFDPSHQGCGRADAHPGTRGRRRRAAVASPLSSFGQRGSERAPQDDRAIDEGSGPLT
jgi:hypothetical protein